MIGTMMPRDVAAEVHGAAQEAGALAFARIDGMHQYRPHQRRKNSVVDSSTTTTIGFVI